MPPKCEKHGVAVYRDQPCIECAIGAAEQDLQLAEAALLEAERERERAAVALRRLEANR